jgi:hypothetical protein
VLQFRAGPADRGAVQWSRIARRLLVAAVLVVSVLLSDLGSPRPSSGQGAGGPDPAPSAGR